MTDPSNGLRAIAGESGAMIYTFDVTEAGAEVTAATISEHSSLAAQVGTAADFARDVRRAVRHLGLSDWELISVECSDGTVALAAAGEHARVAVVAAPRNSPIGLVNRMAGRAAQVSSAKR